MAFRAQSTPRDASRQSIPPTVAATPNLGQRSRSHEPPSAGRSLRTPIQDPSRYLGSSAHKGLSASARRRTNAPTPYSKAASNTIKQRRAALTPGRRRQSDLPRRESGRRNLQLLSRLLAPGSQAIRSSSSPRDEPSSGGLRGSGDGYDDDDDDELPIDRPRLSMPLAEDDDEEDPKPPRSSLLEGDLTMEFARREQSERMPRFSLPDMPRLSDMYGQERLEEEDDGPPVFLPPTDADDSGLARGMDSGILDRVDEDSRRGTMLPRESDFGLAIPDDADPDMDPSTFIMGLVQSSPERPAPLRDDATGSDPALDEEAPPLGDGDWPERFDQPSDQDDDDDNDEGAAEENAAGALGESLRGARPVPDAQIDVVRHERSTRKPGWKVSKHGHPYPPFPPATVKRVSEQFARTSGIPNPRISKDTLAALQQASDWFFEQVSEDLGAYAAHAGRKTVNESDMEVIMRRQRQLNSTTTMFSLATQYLPAELVGELRMPPPVVPRKRQRATVKRSGDHDDEEQEGGES